MKLETQCALSERQPGLVVSLSGLTHGAGYSVCAICLQPAYLPCLLSFIHSLIPVAYIHHEHAPDSSQACAHFFSSFSPLFLPCFRSNAPSRGFISSRGSV